MKNKNFFAVGAAAVVYLILFLLAATSGLIHPACYAYAGTVLPLLFSFVYLYTAAKVQGFGAAVILNGFVLFMGLILGEGNPPLIIGLIILTVLTEIIRKLNGYDTLKGVRLSFIPFAYSFYPYAAHWWTDMEGSLAEAAEEMPAGYGEMMNPVIENTTLLIVMLILVIPVAVLGTRLAEKVMKNQSASLK